MLQILTVDNWALTEIERREATGWTVTESHAFSTGGSGSAWLIVSELPGSLAVDVLVATDEWLYIATGLGGDPAFGSVNGRDALLSVAGSICVEGAPAAACPATAYRSDAFGFGFDPPPDFAGPFADDLPSPDDLFAADFVFDDLLQVDVGVWAFDFSLGDWLATWIDLRTSGGQTLIGSESFVMPSGVEASILEWFDPTGSFTDFYWIELWAVQSGLMYKFWTLMVPGDFASFEDAILRSYRSACVD